MNHDTLENGDVVLVHFPFTDLTRTKVRPAVIISTQEVHAEEEDRTLLFISSVIPDTPNPYETVFDQKHIDFKKSGLKKTSLFKCNKIATIKRKLILRKLGVLGKKIKEDLQEAFLAAIEV